MLTNLLTSAIAHHTQTTHTLQPFDNPFDPTRRASAADDTGDAACVPWRGEDIFCQVCVCVCVRVVCVCVCVRVGVGVGVWVLPGNRVSSVCGWS